MPEGDGGGFYNDNPCKELDYLSHQYGMITTLDIPTPSKWCCYVFGTKNIVWRPQEGHEPNWFWRTMQYLCFGNRWVKDE